MVHFQFVSVLLTVNILRMKQIVSDVRLRSSVPGPSIYNSL